MAATMKYMVIEYNFEDDVPNRNINYNIFIVVIYVCANQSESM